MFSKAKQLTWGGRKRKVASVLTAFVLVASGSALAAFFIYSGVTGNSGGSASGNVQTVGALTLANDGVNLSPANQIDSANGAGGVAFKVTNPSGQRQTVSSISAGTLTSNPSNCASFVSVNASALQAYFSSKAYAAGTTNQPEQIANVLQASNLPVSCASATFDLPLSGTTVAG